MRTRIHRTPASRGFTLLDMVVSLLIMTILASVIGLSWVGLREKAERIGCTSHLRALHVAFTGYVQDHGHWPQDPEDLGDEGYEFYGWIIGELLPYGGSRAAWICPSDDRRGLSDLHEKEFEGSYTPTLFDMDPDSPWKWKQPWLIERTDNHSQGQLLILPDGTVHTSQDAMIGGL